MLVIISSILNVGMMLSLAFAMGVAALGSLLAVRLVKDSSVRVELKPNTQRLFKHDKFSVSSIMTMTTPRWVSARFASLQAPVGVKTQTEVVGENSVQILIEPLYAGRHRGIEVTAEVSDPLDLFKKEIKIEYSDFTIDALPSSLLAPIPRTRPSSLGVGEASSRFTGASVELYSLDEYKPYGETKNILWKKVSRMPDEKLVVRVRESNNPRFVKIGLITNAPRNRLEDRVILMDRVCESIGFLGNNLLAIGCSVEIAQAPEEALGGIAKMYASNIEELAEILMAMWDVKSGSMSRSEIVEMVLKSDIVVTGFREVQDKNLAMLVSKKFSLLIKEGTPPPAYASEKTTIYSGNEDLRRLVVRVVEK